MRTLSTKLFALLFAALLFTGCGGSSEAPAVEEMEDTSTEMASDAIVIEAGDQLQFSVTEFTAAAGSNVHIMLKNVGSLPKETFGHNIVFLTAGADLQAFGQAAVSAADNEYIPADMADWVLANSTLLGPGEEAMVMFTAPTETGTYEFLCSFPGHYGTMRGVMTVE